MKARRIARLFLISISVGIVLTIISIIIPITSSDMYETKRYGWPLTYNHTINTRGDCVGFLDELPPVDDCMVRKFPKNNTNLALNFVFYTLVTGIVVKLVQSIPRRGSTNRR